MNIDRVGGGGVATLPPGMETGPLTSKQAGGADSAQLLANLMQSVEAMEGPGAKKAAEGRPGPPGAPALEVPAGDFSADQLSLVLAALSSKNNEAQMKTAKDGLEITKQQKAESNKKAMEKLEEALRKHAEAKEKAKSGGIFGWISKIAAFIGAIAATVAAVAATVATGGAAAPLLALAAMALVATTMDLANHISQNMDPPGPDLTMGSLMTKMVVGILTAPPINMSEEKAKDLAPTIAAFIPGAAILAPDLIGQAAAKIAVETGVLNKEQAQWLAMAVTLAVTIAVTVATVVASGGASAAGAAGKTVDAASKAAKTADTAAKAVDAAAKAADTTAKAVKTAAQVTQASASIVSGASNIAQGAIKIDAAKSTADAEKALADKKEMDAMLMKLAKQMEEETERIKELVENLDASFTMVSQMIASAGETRLQQTRNVV